MDDPSDDGDDLLSRISRNVEANLESIQQRSAWETATTGQIQKNLNTTTRLPANESTLFLSGDESNSLYNNKASDLSSVNIQHWPSPLGNATANKFQSISDASTGHQELLNVATPRVKTSIKSYMEESTFIRPDSIKSSSMLQLVDILSQHILLHPFAALRRTCQVNRKCSPFICVQPFSLLPFLYHKQRKHGFSAMYKGLSSALLVKGITLGTETALANYTDWPREIGTKRILSDSIKVLTLRGISIALSTPFLCTAVIETVQSVIVVKERPSFIDCLKDGLLRLTHLRSTPSNRMLPIWLLIVPTVFYYVSHSALQYVARNCIEFLRSNMLSRYSRKFTSTRKVTSNSNDSRWRQESIQNQEVSRSNSSISTFELESQEISTSIVACLAADIALLPVETVLNSLYIQGTRTIIDNCDETTVVLPVLTNFEGFADCYQSIMKFEGQLGLYKGMGALILQYSIHFLIFRSLYYLLREFQASGSDINAPKNSSFSKSKIETQVGRVRNEFEPHYNNRHSTPNNPVEGNRYAQERYRTGTRSTTINYH